MNDTWLTRPYDDAYLFDMHALHVSSIYELSEALLWLETEPHSALVRGQPIVGEYAQGVRRALHDHAAKGSATICPVAGGVPWFLADFDKIPVVALGLTTNADRLAYLISIMPTEFRNVTYHYQWSSSAFLRGADTLSCHIWFYIENPVECATLQRRVRLDPTWSSARLDPAPFVVNQVLYTAAPIFVGADDPLRGQRSGLVRGARDAVAISPWNYGPPVSPARRRATSAIIAPAAKPEFTTQQRAILCNWVRSPYIADWMRAIASEPGQRDFRFLTAVAKNALRKGLPIDTDLLADLGRTYSYHALGRAAPDDIVRQAENALEFATQAVVEPLQQAAGPCRTDADKLNPKQV